MTIEYLFSEDVLEMHDTFVDQFGGLRGTRDLNLFLSAVEIPQSAMFGYELHPTLYDKAAAYLYHIVQNHPFNDGNKRTGFGATLLFLKANQVPIHFDKKNTKSSSLKLRKVISRKKKLHIFYNMAISKRQAKVCFNIFRCSPEIFN